MQTVGFSGQKACNPRDTYIVGTWKSRVLLAQNPKGAQERGGFPFRADDIKPQVPRQASVSTQCGLELFASIHRCPGLGPLESRSRSKPPAAHPMSLAVVASSNATERGSTLWILYSAVMYCRLSTINYL